MICQPGKKLGGKSGNGLMPQEFLLKALPQQSNP
jgi:hypothetical protein